MEEIIEFKNIKKAYGEKVVMENFNLTIKKGEFITIIGSSGGGKTTIMKMGVCQEFCVNRFNKQHRIDA